MLLAALTKPTHSHSLLILTPHSDRHPPPFWCVLGVGLNFFRLLIPPTFFPDSQSKKKL
jgi:hypothetical protein